MDRIVHFDFKGAPLRIPYLERVILSAKSWGATGVLLEWEDTFPFSGELAFIGSVGGCGGDGMYSLDEVRHILAFVENCGLKAIQLVQTIGHMEYVLKHSQLASLREQARSPAVLCPSQPKGQQMLRLLLDQILEVQPDADYLHIGADEVWHTAICNECKGRSANSKYNTSVLYLEHIRELALYLKRKRPNLNILMWDDMLRNVSIDAMNDHRLGELVQPVIWDYNTLEHFRIDPSLWQRYKQVFRTVWAGSAFKGANGSCAMIAPEQRYVSNHVAWVKEINSVGQQLNFAGIILTGWSRYDHYATLCELTPVALPSLASCLKTLEGNANATKTQSSSEWASRQAAKDHWPGQEIAAEIRNLAEVRDGCYAYIRSDVVTTWLNKWQLEYNFTSPLQLERIIECTARYENRLSELQSNLQTLLPTVTGPRSVNEWIRVYVTSLRDDVTELHHKAQTRYRAGPSIRPG